MCSAVCACMPFRFKTFQIFKYTLLNNSCQKHMGAADQLHIWSQLWHCTNTKNRIDFYETTFFFGRSYPWERTYVFLVLNMNRTKATYQCRCRSGTSTLHFSFFLSFLLSLKNLRKHKFSFCKIKTGESEEVERRE